MFELNIGNGCLPTSETILLNGDFNGTITNIIESIESLANKVVENEGYIQITRQTEIVSAKGFKKTFSYKTYITYLPLTRTGTRVSLCKSDGKEMLHFRDNINDDSLHEDFFEQEEPVKKIAHLLTQHYMLEKRDAFSPSDTEQLEIFKEQLLSQNVNRQRI